MNNRILELEKQKIIAIADKPLRVGGKNEYIPVAEFEKKIGQPYLDRIDATELHVNLSAKYTRTNHPSDH